MMRNLFGFDSEYFDKYAGLGVNEKLKKWISKSNVDMVLNRFTPFTKTKNLKAPTKTILSIEGTNIDGVDAPVAFHKSGKENKIYVNSAAVDERLSNFDIADQEDEFKRLMRSAYVARSDVESINQRSSHRTPEMIESEVNNDVIHGDKSRILGDMHRQMLLTAQLIQQNVHLFKDMPEPAPEVHRDEVMDLAFSMASGKSPSTAWAQSMMDEVSSMSKKRSDYNVWADKLATKINDSFASDAQINIGTQDMRAVINDDLPLTPLYYVVSKPPRKDEGSGS